MSAYDSIGGGDGVRRLVDAFYDRMAADPVARGILALHPPDLTGSRERLTLFLSGWLGGPQLYVERYGHPRLRARHLHVPIGEAERDAWMHCMRGALEDVVSDPALRSLLHGSLARLADHMRNVEG